MIEIRQAARRKLNWGWLVLPVVVVGGLVLATRSSSTPAPSSPSSPGLGHLTGRAAVVAAAVSQIGNTDPALYWLDTLPGGTDPGDADWCGAFALWCLHRARLAQDWQWEIGSGFLLSTVHHSLPTTTEPKPGDIAYFDHNQHEAIVEAVSPSGVSLINGNGSGGAVTRSTEPRSAVTAFFSIAPLLPGGELA